MHADQRASRTVVWHPYCHLDRHEGQAYARLHQLVGRPVGELRAADHPRRPEERRPSRSPPLLLELPQRDLGGALPPWDDLVAQTAWARERGAAVHLDGARLWEATAGYERPPAEIAALFDTVYVSFYKGVGALPGCCVAGPESDVAAGARVAATGWAARCSRMWPSAASALSLLPTARWPRCRPGWTTRGRSRSRWPACRRSGWCPIRRRRR